MNRVRHIQQWMREGCACRDSNGTVLMECVLVLPLLTLLIFSIVQFALIWYARIMTQYAAYNAARATLVYHPGEYMTTNEQGEAVFRTTSGVCFEAAKRTLAWVSSSPAWQSASGGNGSVVGIPGWYDSIPNSSHIDQQVRIVRSESEEMKDAPVVKVTVAFDYPLHVPVVGRMLAYFDKVEVENPSTYEVWGWNPDVNGLTKLDNLRHGTMNVDYITLRAAAILPKLWRTSRFARKPQSLSNTVMTELEVMQFDDGDTGLARDQ